MGVSAEEYDNWYYSERGKYISGLEKKVLMEMIKLPAISYQPSVIDIGCGTGYFTQFLGNYCRSIVGVDTSMDMIKYAIKKHRDSNIKYLIADAEKLPFKDGSFDVSVSITVLNFIKNPLRAVSEVVRISRKKIFLGVLNRWSMLSFFKKLKSLFINTSYSDTCFYSQGDIVNILSVFPQIKSIYKKHTYFLPFPGIRLVLSGFERIIPSWLPFGGFMGIAGERQGRIG